MQLRPDDRARRKPRLASRALIALGGRMKPDRQTRWRGDAKVLRDVIARAEHHSRQHLSFAFVIVGQREREPRVQKRDGHNRRCRGTRGCGDESAGRLSRRGRRRNNRPAQRPDFKSRKVPIQDLRRGLPRRGEVHRSDDTHPNAVAVAVTVESEAAALSLELECRALDVLPAERAPGDRAKVLAGDFVGCHADKAELCDAAGRVSRENPEVA